MPRKIFFEISDLSTEPNDGTNALPRSINFEDIFFAKPPQRNQRTARHTTEIFPAPHSRRASPAIYVNYIDRVDLTSIDIYSRPRYRPIFLSFVTSSSISASKYVVCMISSNENFSEISDKFGEPNDRTL